MTARSPVIVSLPRDEAMTALARSSPAWSKALKRARSRYVPQTKMIKVELDFDPLVFLREINAKAKR